MRNVQFPSRKELLEQFDLSGRVALVTGGASGLGCAMVWGMACYGADVVIADIRIHEAREVAKEVETHLGQRALPVRADVTDEMQVKKMVEETLQRFQTIDICVNNSGINFRKPVLDMPVEEFERVLATNVRGTFLCAKEVGGVMVNNRRGKMINVASIFGHVAAPTQAAYASSKGAVVQLTKVLALEWAPYNVQVNALSPAHVNTPLTQQLAPELREGILNQNPQQRFAEPEEIIPAAVFLASRASDFVTGTSLLMDGGWTAK